MISCGEAGGVWSLQLVSSVVCGGCGGCGEVTREEMYLRNHSGPRPPGYHSGIVWPSFFFTT